MTAPAAGADPSIAELLAARVDDEHVGLRFEDQQWTWRQVVAASAERASLVRSLDGEGPPHVGVLLGNVPEYLFWLGAAAMTGAVVVGINPTRRGEALAGDIRRTDCSVVVTDADGAALLDGLDLRIPSGKPGTEGGKALEAYAANPNPDNVTLVTLPRLDRAAQAAAWFSALASAGVTIAAQPLDRAALPAWIAARLARNGQHASRDILAFLAERCEGNLLAANQEIQKLALVLPQGDLAQDDVERAIADVARYDVFGLSEAWLAGDAARALRIIGALRAEGEPITLAVWQLGEDLHALSAVHEATQRGMPLQSAVRSVRVWGRRQAALERAAGRLTLQQCELQLRSLARLDALAKGLGQGDSWSALTSAALALCGLPVLAVR